MYKTTERILKVLSTIVKLLIIFIFIFPFVWMISISLQTAEEISSFPATLIPAVPQFVNYLTAWAKAPFFIYLRNSLVVVGVIILVNIVVMVPAAYAFAKYQFKGQKLLFGLVLLAFMTPLQVTFIPVYYTMSDWGLLNTLWPQILPFLVDAFGIFLLRQYFMQVSDELIEAARLDNTSELKIIYKLMLPLSKAAVSTSILFSFVKVAIECDDLHPSRGEQSVINNNRQEVRINKQLETGREFEFPFI